MKKSFSLLALILINYTLLSQSHYRYQGKDIILTPESSLFVVPTFKLPAENQIVKLQKLQLSGKINSFSRLTDNLFLIDGLQPKPEDFEYISNLYKCDNNGIVIILPRILIKFKQEGPLSNILKKYSGILTLEQGGNNRYVFKCNLFNSEEVLNLINELEKSNYVDWVEPEFLTNCKSSNPLYSQQYYLKNTGQNGGTAGVDINVEPAWSITNGNPCITIAIIDHGVDRNHEDLGNRVLEGFTIRNANGLGVPQNANTLDTKYHGMACAGIVAASNNTIGLRGVASNISILPINIVPDEAYELNGIIVEGYGSNLEIAQAINWAWRRADVLSCSWGSLTPSNEVTSAIDSARSFGRSGKGSLVVFASGNLYPNVTDVLFPAYVNGVVTVGAINNQGTIWNYSQRGASMDLVAPSGEIDLNGDIRTTDRMGNLGIDNGNYMTYFGGTSASCPQVAGVDGLMLSVNPDLTETQIRTLLQQTAVDLGSSGFDNTYGYGRVNAAAAVNASLPSISGPSIVCSSNSSFTLTSLPTGSTCSWTFSPGNLVTPYSGSDSIAIFHGDSCSIIGEGTITFTYILPGCDTIQVSKQNIIVNGPDYSDIGIRVLDSYGQDIPDQSLLCPYTTYHIYIHNNSDCATSNYTWEVPSGWTLNYTYNDMASINTNDSPWGNLVIKAQTCCSSCGSSVLIHSAYFSESYDCGSRLFLINPNPAESFVEIVADKEIDYLNSKQDDPIQITLADINGVIKFIDKSNELPYRINTSKYQDGIYIIRIIYRGKQFSHRLIIKH